MRRITHIASLAATVLAALSLAGPASAAKINHHRTSGTRSTALHAAKALPRNLDASMANYAAGFMTKGNIIPQGGNRYEPGFGGWADFARGYKASHPADFPG
jgi:outer membrane murein-binding lipoprotein Lpp